MDRKNIITMNINNKEQSESHTLFDQLGREIFKKNEKVGLLLDFDGIYFSNVFYSSLTGFYRTYGDTIKASAFCGVNSGVRRIILDSTGISFYYTIDKDDGFDWLVEYEEGGS